MIKYIKFENRLRPELRKMVEILEFCCFPTLIHRWRYLEDFENKQNKQNDIFWTPNK